MARSSLIFLMALVGTLCAATALAAAANRSRGGFVDAVWVDGVPHSLATGPAPANAAKTIRLYVIAPVSATRPLHPLAEAKPLGFGAHDHVAQIPKPDATFTGVCDLTLVVPGPKAVAGSNVELRKTLTPAGVRPLLYAAQLGSANVPLNRVVRIQRAEHLGLAMPVDTKIHIACTITPRRK